MHAEIIARLEKLTGPDSATDKAILAHFGYTWRGMDYWHHDNKRTWGISSFPTHSLDAAISLVERVLPGAWYILGKGKVTAAERLYGAQLMFGSEEVIGEGESDASLAIALLLAMFRALSGRER